jgi:hypothetical protein
LRLDANKYSLTGQDAVRQRFTGYQKDLETELDFAENRMYQNMHGRSSDPAAARPLSIQQPAFLMNKQRRWFPDPLSS